MLTGLLHSEDLDLRTAIGGHAGLVEAAAFDPDLILLDLTMTDLDGAAFLERYRGATLAPAPVVLLTGALDGRSRAQELGVASYLGKPFELGELVELLDVHISSHDEIAPG
jgi:DNA-binding response OmpR family regulator